MSKILQCVDAAGQPRLIEGEIYELLFDVVKATNGADDSNKSGYLVKVQGSDVAIPYVYRRGRFAAYEGSDTNGDF